MALVRLRGHYEAEEVALLAAACQTCAEKLYIIPRSQEEMHDGVTEALLQTLRHWYEVVSRTRPMLNVIPLLEWSGWSTNRVAQLEDLDTMYTIENDIYESDIAFLRRVNGIRVTENRPVVELMTIEPVPLGDAEMDEQHSDVDIPLRDAPMAFDNVVVGGTYDRLHAGHRLLLSASALASKKMLLVGITDDQYLLTKECHDEIQSFHERQSKVVDFVYGVRPELKVLVSKLTDPKEPVLAETESEFQALVVSRETIPGGEAVNASRIKRGFNPLTLIVVGLVGQGYKLSSSDLRTSDLRR